MSNTIAIVLGVCIVGSIVADLSLAGGENLVFLGKKLAELIEWIAFWR